MSKRGSVVAIMMMMMLTASATAAGITQTLKFKAGNWGASLESEKETVTNLQFYFHDTVSGQNPSAVRIVEPVAKSSLTMFGAILMVDDPLTETSDPKSKLVGRAQGLYGSSCQRELGLLMAMSFSFIDGPYNGSSFTLMGKNSVLNPVREMPIMGGTGLFRMARGYALAKTYWADVTTGDAIVGYNVTLVH